MINKLRRMLALPLLLLLPAAAQAEPVDENQLGAWYMYFMSARFDNSNWGVLANFQLRTWDVGTDMERMVLRGGVTYSPDSANVRFAIGYASMTSGEFGDSDATTHENRVYEEILLPDLSFCHFFRKSSAKSGLSRIAHPSRHDCLRDGLQGSLKANLRLIDALWHAKAYLIASVPEAHF